MTSRLSLPEAYLKRMQSLLGPEFPAFLASYSEPPVTGLRVNTLKLSPQTFQNLFPFHLQPVPWCLDGFTIGDTVTPLPGKPAHQLTKLPTYQPPTPGKHPYHAAGLYYLQDPSAMAVVELLDPQPGERVLDLAAAPGGKTTHIAARMQNEGLLVANEIHPRRVWELAENLERWGARNAVLLNETPQRLAGHFTGFFDRVLLDAPCSGEGMFRKSEAARADWSPDLVQSCALRQTGILQSSAGMVRPGGVLVYSTCTFAPLENERVISDFLETQPDFELAAAPPLPGFSRGRPDWINTDSQGADLARAVRLWPHKVLGEGHFIAVLRRADSGAEETLRPYSAAKIPSEAARLFKEFSSQHLNTDFDVSSFALVGSYLYRLPQGLPVLGGLKVIHPGWWLGAVKKGRFEPAHALALALRETEVRQAVRLASDGAEVLAYLRGETLRTEGEDGWLLVTVDGFPLGWGKRVGGTVKNYYPKGLRR